MSDQIAEATLLRTRFDVDLERAGATSILRLRGELDVATAPRLRRILSAALDEDPAAAVLDLTDLTFLDTSGVRVIRAACIRAVLGGCSFSLLSPCPAVRRTLALTGLAGDVDIDERATAMGSHPATTAKGRPHRH